MNESRQRKCVICRSPLNEGALQCLACKGFQNPFRRFLSNIDIKSLVALVPVVALAFAFLQDRFSLHGSEVFVTALNCETSKIMIVATNTGDRPGIIKTGHVRVNIDGTTSENIHKLSITDDSEEKVYTVVKPEDQVFLTVVPMEGDAVTLLPQHPIGIQKCTYQLELEVIEFKQQSNETKIIYTSCDCPK